MRPWLLWLMRGLDGFLERDRALFGLGSNGGFPMLKGVYLGRKYYRQMFGIPAGKYGV